MKKALFAAVFFVSALMTAQDIELKSGNLAVLKGQSDVNVEFDYSKLTLMKEKKTEAQYIEERAADLNEKNKGNGEVWKKKWQGAKDGIWQPKFLELVNTIMNKGKSGLSFTEGAASAKYTLIVEAVWIFPGWDAGVMKQKAKVSLNMKLVETANKSNVVALVQSEEAPGDQWGSNFSNESRIGEGFAKTGKSFGQLLMKKAFK